MRLNAQLPVNSTISFSGNKFNNYIDKRINNSSFNTKQFLLAAVILDTFGNLVDYHKTVNNKEIPNEKRKYIGAYKLVNAGASFLTEILSGFIILNDKIQNFMSKKLFGGFEKTNPDIFNKSKIGLEVASTLILATVLVKRLLVPFLITPFASYIKDKYCLSMESKKNSSARKSCSASNRYALLRQACKNQELNKLNFENGLNIYS